MGPVTPSSLLVIVSLCFAVFEMAMCEPVPTLPPVEETLHVDDDSSVGILTKGITGLTETLLKGVLGGVLGGVG